MKRILFLITKEDVGGAQKYLNDLAAKLDHHKFEVAVFSGGGGRLSALSNAFRPYFLFLNDWVAVVQVYKLLRDLRPDALHLNSSKAGVVGALGAALYRKIARRPLRVVFTAHGWVFNPTNRLSSLRRRFYIALHRFAARFQDAIISVSEYDDALARRCRIAPPEKLFVVRNGIDHRALHFLPRTAARETLLFGERPTADDFWVGSIGRLVKEKNYETLVSAATLTPENFKFFIIGAGPEGKKIERLIRKNKLAPRFRIIPDIAPAAPYLTAFDAFILTSIKEGLPYTLLEAMAAAVPIVATKIGGMPEVIEGRGLIIPPQDAKAAAEAIKEIAARPEEAKKRAKAAYEFLTRELTLEKMTEGTAALY